MLALRYDVINTARVSEIRTIVIEFTSGRSLMVKNPGDGYTAWEANVTDWGLAEG